MALTKAEFEARLRSIIKQTVQPTASAFFTADGRVAARGTYNLRTTLASLSGTLYDEMAAAAPAPAPAPEPAPAPAPTTTFFRANQQVHNFVNQYPDLAVIADQPTSVWFGNEWISDPTSAAANLVNQAAGKTALITIYSIPGRDNGQYSAGGLSGPAAYNAWIDKLAAGAGKAPVWYFLEPDALGLIPTDSTKRAERISMLRSAVARLKRDNPNARVYLDASMWVPPQEMANRIKECNPGNLDGFCLNVSGYKPMSECIVWANQVSDFGGLHYVVDTSRNGKGTAGDVWCNPSGQGLGVKPTTATNNPRCDAYLWIKAPGESDGTCNGGPAAGQFWVDRARELVRNAA